MRNHRAGNWNVTCKRKKSAIAGVSICILFVILRFRSTTLVFDDSVFPQVDEIHAGNFVTESRSPVVDYKECLSDQTVLQFAAQNQLIRRAVSVKVFESSDGKPARRGLVATEEISENQVHASCL